MMLRLLLIACLLPLSYSVMADSKVTLGKLIFEDTQLSEPAGQSCGSCHQSNKFYADPGKVVSPGANTLLHGNRNAPSIAYIKFNPELHWDADEALWMGGFFYDGRAKTLTEQAGGPFLNPLEMGNTTKASVVEKVKQSAYGNLFKETYGAAIFNDVEAAFYAITDAIVAYEQGPEFALFNSKYDYYLQGKAQLSAQEKRGLELFEAEDKGNCAACHPSQASNGQPPLFTDYSYDNLGHPANPNLAFYLLDKKYNPQGKNYIDNGLADNPYINNGADEKGKFKVTTLRNIAGTAPYLHHGIFDSLEEVVDFYNTRDSKKTWGKPEVKDNMNTEELGDLKLTAQEVKDIVAFLETLSDGYSLNEAKK